MVRLRTLGLVGLLCLAKPASAAEGSKPHPEVLELAELARECPTTIEYSTRNVIAAGGDLKPYYKYRLEVPGMVFEYHDGDPFSGSDGIVGDKKDSFFIRLQLDGEKVELVYNGLFGDYRDVYFRVKEGLSIPTDEMLTESYFLDRVREIRQKAPDCRPTS